MAKVTTNEFTITYLRNFKNIQSLINHSCKNWNSAAKSQLRKKVKHLEDVIEDESSKSKFFEISFQNGSKAFFLFIPENLGVFELHTQIRESFSKYINESNIISFNILTLGVTHQEILVPALSSLVYLGKWNTPSYGKKNKLKRDKTKKDFGFYSDLTEISELIDKGKLIAEGTNLVRTLALTPTNYLTSSIFVQECKNIVKKLKNVEYDFIDETQLKKLNAGCFLSVIRGSNGSDGGIVHLKYTPNQVTFKKVALVGKGVCFDTGGYSIKDNDGMISMNRDMTGAAVVLAIFEAVVKSNMNIELDVYLAIGENLISEKAYKPDEVVTAMDGTTVLVLDTDAEGRMLLADTILYAKQNNPDLIIDFATLTGDAIKAVDKKYSCVMSNVDDFLNDAMKIGYRSGERVWAFPTTYDYSRTLESEIADIRQCTTSSNAEHIYAACFLRYFAGEVPWIHVDLSSEECEGGLGLVSTDVTGFGVRWGYEFLEHWSKNG